MVTHRIVAALTGIALALGLGAAPPAKEKRVLLADHDTVARLTGVRAQQCRGLTSLCPDRCGHSGNFATFEIVAYVSYTKAGEYGDPKGESFTVQVDDNMGNAKLPKAMTDQIGQLKPGDLVHLHWHHDYVTRTEDGGSSSFPERPIVGLDKVTKADADKLVNDAAGK